MFVSRETKAQLDQLEKEKNQLQSDLSVRRDVGKSLSKWKLATGIFGVLFVVATAWAVYLALQKQEPAGTGIQILTEEGLTTGIAEIDSGLVYTVQIGAFKDFDLNPFAEHLDGLYQRKNDSLQRIALGRFSTFKEAQHFQNELHKLNFDFAYITAYRDGQSVALMSAIRSEK